MNRDLFAAWLASPPGAAVSVAWAFVTGCMAGSFLNVVAHRVPRGETVVFGRSRCPACGATIRARDNVPLFGWMLLRGRCRDCGTAISMRYPLIEAGCGCLAAALAAAEWAASPTVEPTALATAWAGRTCLGLTLVAWALLAARGHTVSAATVGAVATAAGTAAVLLPALRPLEVWCPGSSCAPPEGAAGRLAGSVAGLVAGWLAGSAAGRGPARAACAVVGAALGWQAALAAATVAWLGLTACQRQSAACLAPAAVILASHPLAWAWEAACRAASAG